jgi:amino acid adenylation domain-containing protein
MSIDEIKSLTGYLEDTAARMPDKVMFTDEHGAVTFGEFTERAQNLAMALSRHCGLGEGIAIIVDRSIRTPLAYAASLYAGAFYIPIDAELPLARKRKLIDISGASLLLIAARDHNQEGNHDEFDFGGAIVTYEELESEPLASAGRDGEVAACGDTLRPIRTNGDTSPATGPMCVIFTSGSTGSPKGVALSHGNVLRYLIDFASIAGLDSHDRLACQSPPDYVAALRDLYFPFICGASTYLTPKRLFSFPSKLAAYLNEHRVTALFWVAPVLSYCANLKVFDACGLTSVDKVVFTGSVLPCPHLRYWQEHLPRALFINHYGPTEATATVSYYIVDHLVADDETLPIGTPLPSVGVELVDERGCRAKHGEKAEIYVRGGGVSLGYWRDPDMTEKHFPLIAIGERGRERYFRTGDIGSLLPDGNLMFHGRKDSQIKLMGHRIEPAEIDGAAARIDGVGQAICVYDQERQLLVLFYTGKTTPGNLAKRMRETLPDFMMPRRFHKVESIPRLPGGKPDMRALRAMAREE